MLDFFTVSTRSVKKGTVEIYPKFIIRKSKDLMIRGGDFYAVWLEERGLWSTDEQDAIQLIDKELDNFAKEHEATMDGAVHVLHLWDAATGMIDIWHKYCQKQMRDSFSMLDERIIFANEETGKKDYASKKLSYPLEEGEPESWNKLVSTLYSPEERKKIEWCIGSIVAGDSTRLQKFAVLYGAAGTGKSTILSIIQQLFDGYTSVFDAKALGSASNVFALEAFKTNPLVAIQHDGDLSRIEDNTRLNSLVSHELMTVNEKFKSTYSNRFKAFLWMGTNKPVKITDAKSGLIRRLIDISPTGNKLPAGEYKTLMKRIPFELGKIAWRCRSVYEADTSTYDDYIPLEMLGASNDFFNFVEDSWMLFKKEDQTTLKAAWEMYKTYCDDAKVAFPYSQRAFKEELKNYFREYKERVSLPDGTRQRNLYSGFRADRFEATGLKAEEAATDSLPEWLHLTEQPSKLDAAAAACQAQYATEDGTPTKKWSTVTKTLRDISTDRLHYVKVPENLVVIDFDLKNPLGKKSRERNLAEASKWPPTYAEYSQSGQGLHLHYWYNGDVNKLSRIFGEDIEVKVFTGLSSLRRKLTACNNLDIAVISSGLPLKEESKTINFEGVKNEKSLRTIIRRNLLKEYHGATKPSVDFIKKVLDDAYISDLSYDVSDLRPSVIAFAAGSTHQAELCLKNVMQIHFQSKDHEQGMLMTSDAPGGLVFYDVEVFPNLFLVNWKEEGEGKPVVRLINPKPSDIEEMLKYKLVGFNCRRYDNHMLYGRLIGYSNEQLYKLSQRIVNGHGSDAFFGEAYNLSYTDVYDFSSKKQSLKKFEIELGIHHQELGLPWDQPVPEELWEKVAEYCDNDVIATEAVWNALQSDFLAREILAAVAGMSVNDTTNSLTTRIIFGKERKPQSQFNYRNLAEPVRQ